eukprot:c18143_g1_i1.p1 GENE.c18143_g1_i1~~c18143_g1_i1.p1  ORF type:complete len:749 (+),score=76.65 c18143_g1_i1:26-2248(+)
MSTAAPPKPWICPRCTFQNTLQSPACDVCRFRRAGVGTSLVENHGAQKKPVTRAIPLSTLHRYITRVNCQIGVGEVHPQMGSLGFGATPLPPKGVGFRVWAPGAIFVGVAGSFNGWAPCVHLLHPEPDGDYCFSGIIPNAKVGDNYAYTIYTSLQSATPLPTQAAPTHLPNCAYVVKNDPRGRYLVAMPLSVIHESVARGLQLESQLPPPSSRDSFAYYVDTVVYRAADYNWTGINWCRPPLDQVVMYEINIHSFTEFGTFRAAIQRLPYLRQLGVNCIALMPHTQDLHDTCWGYDPVSLHAMHDSTGSPADLCAFIDSCHLHGIAVIFDFVANHMPDKNVLVGYGATKDHHLGAYFPADRGLRGSDFGLRFNLSHPRVRDYLTSALLLWIQEYRFDGVRVDSTGTLRAGPRGLGNGDDLISAWSLMQEWTSILRHHFPGRYIIAEDLQHTSLINTACAGFDAQWDSHYFFALYKACTSNHDHTRDLNELTDAISRTYLRTCCDRIIYTENHDTIPGDRQRRLTTAIGDGNAPAIALRRSLLSLGLLMTSPGIPLILQGQEYGETRGPLWPIPPVVDWAGPTNEVGGAVFQTLAILARLRSNSLGVTKGLTGAGCRVTHNNSHETTRVFVCHRWHTGGPGDDTMVLCNLCHNTFKTYQVGVPRAGLWHIRCNTAVSPLGIGMTGGLPEVFERDEGPTDGSQFAVAKEGWYDKLPFSISVRLCGYSVCVLSQDPVIPVIPL